MEKVTLNDGQELLTVNDIFIGPRYHTSVRYPYCIEQDHDDFQLTEDVS